VIRTLGQKRAEFALREVLNIQDANLKKDFKNFSAGAPSTILQNGFGQAMAFWLSKGTDKDLNVRENDKHIKTFDIIMKWLSYDNGTDVRNTFATRTNRREFIQELAGMSQQSYFVAQKETLALLEWVKRYANAGL